MFSAAHLGRPTFDKQHRTDEESRGWKKMRTHSDQTVHSMLYKLNVHPSFESPAVFFKPIDAIPISFCNIEAVYLCDSLSPRRADSCVCLLCFLFCFFY